MGYSRRDETELNLMSDHPPYCECASCWQKRRKEHQSRFGKSKYNEDIEFADRYTGPTDKDWEDLDLEVIGKSDKWEIYTTMSVQTRLDRMDADAIIKDLEDQGYSVREQIVDYQLPKIAIWYV